MQQKSKNKIVLVLDGMCFFNNHLIESKAPNVANMFKNQESTSRLYTHAVTGTKNLIYTHTKVMPCLFHFYSPALKKWGVLDLPCPSVILSFHNPSDETWISLKPVGRSWSNFTWSIIRVGARLHEVLGQIGLKLGFPWQQKAPIDL